MSFERNTLCLFSKLATSFSKVCYVFLTYTLIIGSPIWGGLLSSPVKSFLSGYDLSGKKILPFCTHGGSGTAQSVDNIRKLCPHAEILLFMAVKLQTLGMK